jgi:uncharacterized membrane protein YeaQ/YmgE (transglycosylase-associated protein family)
MNLIAWIILGVIAGWLASVIMGTRAQQSILGDVLLGVLGAVVGGFLMNLFGGAGVTGLNLWSLAVATLGAVLLVAARRAVL